MPELGYIQTRTCYSALQRNKPSGHETNTGEAQMRIAQGKESIWKDLNHQINNSRSFPDSIRGIHGLGTRDFPLDFPSRDHWQWRHWQACPAITPTWCCPMEQLIMPALKQPPSVQSFGIRSNVASSVILAHLSFPTWERLRLQEQCPQVKLLSPRIPPSSFHWYCQTALPGRGTAPSPTSIWVCPLLSLVRSAIFSALILVNLIGEKHCMSLYLHFNFSNKWIWSFYKCSIFGNMNNKINNTGLQPKEWNKYP